MSTAVVEQEAGSEQQTEVQSESTITIRDVVAGLKVRANASRRPSHPELGFGVSGPIDISKYAPTISLNPAVITDGIEGYSDYSGYVSCAVDAFDAIYSALGRLSEARDHVRQDASKTEADQILSLADEASKLQDSATRKFDSARKQLTTVIESTERQLTEPVQSAASHGIASEIRQYVLKLSATKRIEFLHQAMQKGDVKTLQAVLGAQSHLSGITDEMQAHFTREFHEKQNPMLAKRLEVMRKALALIEERGGLILTEVPKALGARWDVVKQLRALRSDAQARLLLINNPVPR